MNESTLKQLAERIHKARQNRDYSLATHLLRPYQYGTPERNAIEAELQALGIQMRDARNSSYGFWR